MPPITATLAPSLRSCMEGAACQLERAPPSKCHNVSWSVWIRSTVLWHSLLHTPPQA
eukprot:CAMPEP_0195110960 /NCGR_PEP_ID=MMETSP0448-20130528/94497_1 /TAXON_ID=66468 /ORGANISM="Heterocapsa triquestra, Strain CCMP 448" /LENGTH=56 /DNA_ID=CAMNT_0040147703 /DNA_START=353 /DNA_END=523 /DNA_ORIENTATION=-